MIVLSSPITVTLPDWLYVCMDLDLMTRRLNVYIDDKQLNLINSGLNNTWDLINFNSLQLTRLTVHNEKVGLINLFSESFQPGTCGKNGSLLSWPLMFASMQPMGQALMDIAALCRADHPHLVFIPFKTTFNSALGNCNKITVGGRFPIYSSLEARGKFVHLIQCIQCQIV